MKRKIYLLALFLCFFLQSIFSQIEVKSFRLLENDLAANTHATMVKDKNGEVAALIKVVTTERGFTFEAGMSGIVKVKQEAGEIWVYVPSPLSRITIRHPQYGVLRDYYFDIPIEKARTYEMVLFTPKEEPVQSRVVNRQLLVFEVTPPFATVELDGELLKVSEEGRAERDALFGKRSYRVFAPDYHTVEGEVELNDPVNTHVVKVDLMPQFGWLQIPETDSLAKAKIYINQKNMGTVPFRSEAMQSGIYHLKIKKPHYKVYREKVEVKDNQTIEFRPQLQRRFTATKTDAWSSIRVSYSTIALDGDNEFEESMPDGDLLDDYNYNGFALEYIKGYGIVENMPVFLETGLGFQWINWNIEEDWYYYGIDHSIKRKLNITSLYVPLNIGYQISLSNNLSVMPYVGLNVRYNLTAKYSIGEYLDGYLVDEKEYEIYEYENPIVVDMLDDDREKGLGRNTMKRFIPGWQIGANVSFNDLHIGVKHGCSFGAEVFNNLNSELKSTTISIGYNF